LAVKAPKKFLLCQQPTGIFRRHYHLSADTNIPIKKGVCHCAKWLNFEGEYMNGYMHVSRTVKNSGKIKSQEMAVLFNGRKFHK
jgi:hypothetical protein